MENNQNFN